jgi:thioesterase domain-containing protein
MLRAEPPAGTAPAAASVVQLEALISQVWKGLFGREDIARDENFFGMGGRSLLAAQAMEEIGARTGRRLAASALFCAPTIAALAKLLAGDPDPAASSPILPLQPEGSKPPLFCAYAIGGDSLHFGPLARELAPDRPVHGFHAGRLVERARGPMTIEAMAAQCALEIRSVQPAGPYHLIGYSAGGWLAYALARELARRGEHVALLALVDTRCIGRATWPVRIAVDLPYLAYRLPGLVAARLSRAPWGGPRGGGGSRRSDAPPAPGSLGPMFRDYVRRMMLQPGRRYAGEATVFAGGDARGFRHGAFWRRFISGRVTIRRVPGRHGTLIDEEHAGAFAAALRARLAEIERG